MGSTDKEVIMPYKGVMSADVSYVCAPYVPKHVSTAVAEHYWFASELHDDTMPFVVIDGHYLATDSARVRETAEAWIAEHTVSGFLWDKQPGFPQIDILFFCELQDAMLFKVAFSARQKIA